MAQYNIGMRCREKSIAINPKAPDIVVVTRCPGLSFCIYKLHGVILRWMSRTVAKPFQPLDQIVRNHAANYTDKERSKIGEEYLCHKHPSFPVKIDRKAVTVSV